MPIRQFALAPSQPSWRRAAIIAALGLLGVASLLASTIVPADIAAETGLPDLTLRLLLLIQPAILVIGAAILGDRLTRTTWLQAPFISGSKTVSVRSAAVAALIGAAVVGVILAGYTWITTELAPLTLVPGTSLSLLTALLYGGITEEVLIRWGLMGAVVWLLVKVTRRSAGEGPSNQVVGAAILVSSAAFALLHLPALLTLGEPTGINIAAAMVANVLAGIAFGTVFAARGLEAAIGAHAGAHLVGASITALI